MKASTKTALLVTRVFDAPVERVWRGWTDPAEIKRWWGPKGFTAPHIAVHFHVGGKYLYGMLGAGLDGVMKHYWNTGKYVEIVPAKKIVMTMRFADSMAMPYLLPTTGCQATGRMN